MSQVHSVTPVPVYSLPLAALAFAVASAMTGRPSRADARAELSLDFSLFVRLQFCMGFFDSDARKIFVVQCKECKRNIPAGVSVQPKKYIAVRCNLCREARL